jgi:hypothetical protein
VPEAADLSFEDRRALIQRALAAVAGGRLADASVSLAAAIRKARRARIYDLEAEYLRLVALYLAGDYTEAVNRAATCLEALEEIRRDPAWPVADLPVVEVRRVLERAMLQAMVRRGDGIMAITRHLWRRDEGKVYPGKREHPFPEAVREAWTATRRPFDFGIDTIRTELKPFTAVVEAKYDEMTEGESDEEPARPVAAPSARPAAAPDEAGEIDEADAADLFDEIIHREPWKVSHEEMERLVAVCAGAVRSDNVARIARLFRTAPAKDSRRILSGLRRNQVLAQAVAEGRFEAAPPEVVRFLHTAFGAPTGA